MDDYHMLLIVFSTTTGQSSTHTIYCKQHVVRQNSEVTPNLRTLFSVGWPPYCNQEDVESLFSRVGTVKNVFLQDNPGSVDAKICDKRTGKFSVGYVVFSSEKDLKSALELCHSTDPIPCTLSQTGLSKWSQGYMQGRLQIKLLEEIAEVGVGIYDKQHEEAELARKKKAGIPDEDGWITVTRKTPRTSDRSLSHKKKKKKNAQTGLHVYSWQLRESQREQVAELRRKFEEDKKRVANMRAQRRFKPF